jgi:hypothetical protein
MNLDNGEIFKKKLIIQFILDNGEILKIIIIYFILDNGEIFGKFGIQFSFYKKKKEKKTQCLN